MKLRNAGLLVVVLAAAVSCDRGQDRNKPAVAPITQGGSSDPWNQPEADAAPLAKPFLWSIEKDGNTSYLLGTMHLGVDPKRLPPLVYAKLDAAKTFAMETDLSQSNKLDVTRKDGKTLRDDLGEAHWKKLEEVLGAQASGMLNMKPMIPATLLAMRGLPTTAPMDGVLHARATRQAKQMVFLETLQSEMVVLEKWLNARALKDMLDDLAWGDQHAKDMLAAYLAGDDAKLMVLQATERERWKKMGRSDSEYDEQMADLLYNRNAAWLPAIEKLHADGGGFIAVGAAHAVGPRSVLELLQQRGYTVTRVSP